MKKFIFIFHLCFVALFSAQELEKKIANEMCDCIEKIEKNNLNNDNVDDCIMYALEENNDKIILKINDKKNKNVKNTDDYLSSIFASLLSNCKTFFDYQTRNSIPPKKQESISDCEDLKIGAYYYKIQSNNRKYLDYLIFTKNEVIEIRPNNVYAIYNIKWIDNCSYELRLTSTNSNYDDINMRDKTISFRITENTKDYFTVQTEFFQKGNIMNLKIFKLPFTPGSLKMKLQEI